MNKFRVRILSDEDFDMCGICSRTHGLSISFGYVQDIIYVLDHENGNIMIAYN